MLINSICAFGSGACVFALGQALPEPCFQAPTPDLQQFVAEAIAYSEPDVFTPGTNWDGKLGYSSDCRQSETARIPKSNRMPDAPHSVKVETQVVNCVEDLGKYLVGRIKVPQVGPRVALAHAAGAIWVKRAIVPSVSRLFDGNFAFRCEEQSVPRGARGENAIHHVNTEVSVFHNFFRGTNAHQISRLICRKMLN